MLKTVGYNAEVHGSYIKNDAKFREVGILWIFSEYMKAPNIQYRNATFMSTLPGSSFKQKGEKKLAISKKITV